MKQANGVVLYNTEDFKQNIMKWAIQKCVNDLFDQ